MDGDSLTTINGPEAPEGDEETPKLTAKERIRAKRDELRKQQTLTLLVPGYEDELAVRYRAIPGDDMNKFQKRLVKTEAGMKTAEEVMIRCCDTVMAIDDEGRKLEPLVGDREENDFIVLSDMRLAEYLGFEAKSVHEIIAGTFSPDDTRPLAAFTHAQALMSWMQGKNEEIDKSLLGE